MNNCLSYIFIFAFVIVCSCVGVGTYTGGNDGGSTSSGGSSTNTSSSTGSNNDEASTTSSNSNVGYYAQFTHKNFRSAPVFQGNGSNSVDAIRKVDAILFFMVNEEREKAGLPVIPYHEALEVAAYYHSLEMAERDFFSHQNPTNAKRRETSDRAKLAGVANPYIAENILYTYAEPSVGLMTIAEKMMEQWMNSKGHKANILSKDSKQLGCGVYYKDKKWYGTQVFQWFRVVETQAAVDKF